jgi:hypothetical protein
VGNLGGSGLFHHEAGLVESVKNFKKLNLKNENFKTKSLIFSPVFLNFFRLLAQQKKTILKVFAEHMVFFLNLLKVL